MLLTAIRRSGDVLYPGHIPTSVLQRIVLGLGSSVLALTDPWRADMVAVNGEVTGGAALKHLRDKMMADTEGKMVLENRPRINTTTVDFDRLRGMRPETLGYTYATYSDYHRISPDSRDSVQFVDDAELAYVMQRYREARQSYLRCLGSS